MSKYLILYLKAMAMGIADLIPGVSGGTIAFITGIYSDLLNAVNSLNPENIKRFIKLDFKGVLENMPFKFIITLLAGIFTSFILFSRLMHYLITEQKVYTWAFFFGLVLVSIPLLYKKLDDGKSLKSISLLVIGTIFSYLVVGMIPIETPNFLWFISLCGFIGISAMILPGISGSFLLLILGKYELITSALKNPLNGDNLSLIIAFIIGATLSLVSLCRVLAWGYKKFPNPTMAFLTGVLLGSLRKLWPWKEVTLTKEIRGKIYILAEENIIPAIGGEVYFAVFLVLLGMGIILLLEKFSPKSST